MGEPTYLPPHLEQELTDAASMAFFSWNPVINRWEVWQKLYNPRHDQRSGEVVFTIINEDGSYRPPDMRAVRTIAGMNTHKRYARSRELWQEMERAEERREHKQNADDKDEIYHRTLDFARHVTPKVYT